MNGLRTGAAASVLVLAWTAGAAAQEQLDDGRVVVETITVTTQKREQSIQDVPINVTAYDGDFLDDIGVEEFEQLGDFVPGFEVQEQSPNNPGFVIRGITSDSGDATIEPRVSIFLDGVSASRSRGSIVNLFDVERVEVVKGPQSTLFGRAALIGAVSVVTNKAQGEWAAELQGEVSNLSGHRAEGFVNIPIVGDRLAIRGSFYVQERDGFIDNRSVGERDLNGVDVEAYRVSLHAEPHDRLSIDIIGNYQVDTPPGTSFKSGSLPPPGGTTDPNSFATLQTFDDPNGFVFEGDANLGLDRELWSVTFLGELEINEAFTLNSVIGYREFDSLEIFDPDGSSLEALLFAEDATGEQYSQELRLSYDKGGFFSGFIGGNFFYEDNTQRVPSLLDERAIQAFLPLIAPAAFGTLPQQLAFGQTPPSADSLIGQNLLAIPAVLEQLILGGALPPTANPADPAVFAALLPFLPTLKPVHAEEFTNDAETTSQSVFADITLRPLDRLELIAGARWVRDDKTSGLTQTLQNGPSALTGAGLLIPGTAGRISVSDEFDGFAWRFAARYELNDDLDLYFNYGRGRRPEVLAANNGGVVTGFVPAGFDFIDAETVDSFEGGLKSTWLQGRLRIEGSAFYYDYDNFQTDLQDPDTGNIQVVNAGGASSYGVETLITAQPIDKLRLFATYGYNRSRFDDEDSDGNPQRFADNQFRLSPDHALSLGALFRQEFARKCFALEFLPTYVWQSEVFFEDTNDPRFRESSYGVLDFRLRLMDLQDRFELELFVDNALDREFIIDAGNTGQFFGTPTFIAGPPRFFGASVTVRY